MPHLEATNHSPGPYYIDPGPPGESHRIVGPEGVIAHVLPTGDKQQVWADSRLLAASPGLFAALQAILDIPEPHIMHERELEMRTIAREAINLVYPRASA